MYPCVRLASLNELLVGHTLLYSVARDEWVLQQAVSLNGRNHYRAALQTGEAVRDSVTVTARSF